MAKYLFIYLFIIIIIIIKGFYFIVRLSASRNDQALHSQWKTGIEMKPWGI